MQKPVLDRVLSKFTSRKLLVWLTTTGMLFADKLTGDEFVAISLVYLGAQGLADIAATWKHGKVKNDAT